MQPRSPHSRSLNIIYFYLKTYTTFTKLGMAAPTNPPPNRPMFPTKTNKNHHPPVPKNEINKYRRTPNKTNLFCADLKPYLLRGASSCQCLLSLSHVCSCPKFHLSTYYFSTSIVGGGIGVRCCGACENHAILTAAVVILLLYLQRTKTTRIFIKQFINTAGPTPYRYPRAPFSTTCRFFLISDKSNGVGRVTASRCHSVGPGDLRLLRLNLLYSQQYDTGVSETSE